MFQTEMLSNGGRRIPLLVNALMQMPPCVLSKITCITQITFKLINKGLLVDNRRPDFARFQMLFNLVANKYGIFVRAQLKDLSLKIQVTVQPIFVIFIYQMGKKKSSPTFANLWLLLV